MPVNELTIIIDVDIEGEYCCKNCARELKAITNDGKNPLTRLDIPDGKAMIIVPDSDGGGPLHYHIELIDRSLLRKMPHPMQWKCPECDKIYKTRGRFKTHIAEEYGVSVEDIAKIDDAMMQRLKRKK